MKSTGCCPQFNPKLWQNKQVIWKNKLFLKDNVKVLFFMPLNFSKVMVKNIEIIKKAKAEEKNPIVMSKQGPFIGTFKIYISISKKIKGANTKTLSGTFLTKAFEGPYKNMGKWVKEMKEYAKSKRKEIQTLYFYYTTCPKCAKIYGKNYTVILAKIKEE